MSVLGSKAVLTSLLITLIIVSSGIELSQAADGARVSDVVLAGNIVFQLDAAGGLHPWERAEIVTSRLDEVVTDGDFDFRPGYMSGEIVVMAGERLVVTVDSVTAARSDDHPANLARLWANNLRSAIGIEPLQEAWSETGIASWYGGIFNGRLTASGEVFDENMATAAHKTLPFGTIVKVTNLNNHQSVIVRINDRGPFIHGRVIDLSASAAKSIGLFSTGLAPIRLDVIN